MTSSPLTRALVLGAGGQVGISYHLGVLSAIEIGTGCNVNDAPVIVGTSAGSVIGAYVRELGSAVAARDHFEKAFHDAKSTNFAAELDLDLGSTTSYAQEVDVADSNPDSRVDQLRRVARAGVGMAGVFAKTWTRMPIPDAVDSFLGQFPNAMLDFTEIANGFYRELPAIWPTRQLWVTAFDLGRRRRVVFGSATDQLHPDLREALVASCAVPGVWEPRVIDDVAYVDGGVRGPANAGVLVDERYADELAPTNAIIVAPMAFDSWRPREITSPAWPETAYALAFRGARAAANASLERELRALRQRGVETTVFRPTAESLGLHGHANIDERLVPMVAEDAFATTLGQLADKSIRDNVELCLS
jgi:NTE family protein